jgi:hypothetical protein
LQENGSPHQREATLPDRRSRRPEELDDKAKLAAPNIYELFFVRLACSSALTLYPRRMFFIMAA